MVGNLLPISGQLTQFPFELAEKQPSTARVNSASMVGQFMAFRVGRSHVHTEPDFRLRMGWRGRVTPRTQHCQKARVFMFIIMVSPPFLFVCFYTIWLDCIFAVNAVFGIKDD
jgi:hypothetical protein